MVKRLLQQSWVQFQFFHHSQRLIPLVDKPETPQQNFCVGQTVCIKAVHLVIQHLFLHFLLFLRANAFAIYRHLGMLKDPLPGFPDITVYRGKARNQLDRKSVV